MANDDENKVYENCSGYLGGAAYIDSGKSENYPAGTIFRENYASVLGGAIYTLGTVTATGTDFEGNQAENGGGAIAAFSTITLKEVDFSYNETDGSGGAMYCAGKTTGNDVSFTGNTATNGGGIYVLCDSAATVISFTDVSFTGNSATNGGAVFNSVGTIILTNATFSGNTAAEKGGAIYNAGGCSMTLKDVSLQTQTDTINNRGTMTWTGTISVAGEVKTNTTITATGATLDFNLQNYTSGSTTAVIDNLSMISGISAYSVSIKQTQASGTYTLADNASAFAGSVTIKGLSAEHVLTLTSEVSKAAYEEENGAVYTIERTSSGSLNFSIEKIIFVDTVNWTTGASVSCEYGGETYSGTVGDGSFFNSYDEAKAAATKDMVIVDLGTRETYIAGDGLNLTIENGTFSKQVFGGSLSSVENSYQGSYTVQINGGVYKNTCAAGDAVNRGVAISRDGDLNVIVNGGTFGTGCRFCGGMFYVPANSADKSGSVSLYGGDINLAINGGTFSGRIFGGCNAKNQNLGECTYVEGDVNVTVTADSTHRIAINECLVAGSRGKGVIGGSTNVTFSGDGQYLTFGTNSVVFGGSNSDVVKQSSEGEKTVVSTVEGDRNLTFSGFTGDFGAEIRLFGTISFNENSNVVFTDEKLDLWGVDTWNFEFGSSASNVTANEFNDDILNFDMTGYDGQDWNVLSGTTAAFSDFGQAYAVFFDGSEAQYDEDTKCWSDGTYKLSLNETQNGMIVSRC